MTSSSLAYLVCVDCSWMVEMNHKQAEIVVARVLSEKMRLKNKTLAAEYKRLKVH